MKFLSLLIIVFQTGQFVYSQNKKDYPLYQIAIQIVGGRHFIVLEDEDTTVLSVNKIANKNSNIYSNSLDSHLTNSDRSVAKQIILNSFSSDSIKIDIINNQLYHQIFRNLKGWDRFYHKYATANAMVRLSRAYYTSDRTKATLYLSYGRGYLNGAGYIIIMSKDKNNKWVIEDLNMLWVS